MRSSILVAVMALIGVAGCGALTGYLNQTNHFPFGSVKEKEYAKDLKRAYSNTQDVLRERDYSIKKAEIGEQAAQIVAEKDGLKLIFDLTAVGEGTKIHLEINQAGGDGQTWALLTEIEVQP